MPLFGRCPVCRSVLTTERSDYFERGVYFQCPRCGQFGLTADAEARLPNLLAGSGRNAAILSYAISKRQSSPGYNTFLLDFEQAKNFIEAGVLPTPQEQADNLIRFLGDSLSGPGESIEIAFQSHGKILDTPTADAFGFVVAGLLDSGVLMAPRHTGDRWHATLSFAGWARFEELRRGSPSGRNAFMAMQYGDANLDRIVNEYFRPAVRETGFTLIRLDDKPKAGLIDARMMLEIQGAWFVIADVTHGNHGAYWEAGYAAGLRKPVIYTCQRSVWDERKSHFDTNHHLHVVWDPSDMAGAVRELKATIRFTLPDAKQQDDA
jgi:hypothetical protein